MSKSTTDVEDRVHAKEIDDEAVPGQTRQTIVNTEEIEVLPGAESEMADQIVVRNDQDRATDVDVTRQAHQIVVEDPDRTREIVRQ